MRCPTLITAHAAIGFMSTIFPQVKFKCRPSYRDGHSVMAVDVWPEDDVGEALQEKINLAFAAYVAGRGEVAEAIFL